MAEPNQAAAIAQVARTGDFASRVKAYMADPEKLIRDNERDVWIADEARVVAEILARGLEVRPQSFWDVNALGTAATDLSFFDTQGTSSTLNTTNMPGASEFSRDQIFFAKQVAVYLDPDMTQADKRIVMKDHVLEMELYSRVYFQEAIRHLPGGCGLDGELNNGVADIRNVYTLKSYLRIPPTQKFEVRWKRLVALGTGENAHVMMRGLYGRRK